MDVEIFKNIPLSINKIFSSAGLDCRIFYEGQEHNIIQDQPSIHIHVLGPRIDISDVTVLTVRLKVVVSVPENDQGYLIYKLCGQLANIMKNSIPLMDEEYVQEQCLMGSSEIIITHLGKINPELPLKHSTVETEYKVHLAGD